MLHKRDGKWREALQVSKLRRIEEFDEE